MTCFPCFCSISPSHHIHTPAQTEKHRSYQVSPRLPQDVESLGLA